MTLQAVEPVRVTVPPQDGWVLPYDEDGVVWCEIPGCQRRAFHWHHAVPRPHTGGPKDWVCIDGVVVWNKLRVCAFCHDAVHAHKLWISWEDDFGWVVYREVPMTHAADKIHPKTGRGFVRLGVVNFREGRE